MSNVSNKQEELDLKSSDDYFITTSGTSSSTSKKHSTDSNGIPKRVSFRDGRSGEDDEDNIDGDSSQIIGDSNGAFDFGELTGTVGESGGGSPRQSSIGSGPGLVDVAYYETLMQDKEPWEDPTYLAGFKDIFSTDQLWMNDVTMCTSRVNTLWEIQNKDSHPLFYIDKHQSTILTWLKTLILHPFKSCRIGFNAKIRSLEGTLLITFIRKTNFSATQLDIVETFYGKEFEYVGRIERSSHGYLLRDKNHQDIYRVLEVPASSYSRGNLGSKNSRLELDHDSDSKSCTDVQKELRIFRTDTREPIGRLSYVQRGFWLRFCSGCSHYPEVGIICNSDVGTNAKILLIGTLLFLVHCRKDGFVNLPLGSDAIGFNSNPEPDVLPDEASEHSLNLLMK